MKDDYSHDDMNILYITESIPGPAEDTFEYDMLLADFNSQLLDSCICAHYCTKITCQCLKVSQGENYSRYCVADVDEIQYSLNRKLAVFKMYPILECNSNCTCPEDCGNRIVQQGPMAGLIVKPCENAEKGLGLFTPHNIRKGTFICEYAGEVLTKSQAIARCKENDEKGLMNYVFCLNEHTYQGLVQTFIDPSKFGNIGRYINHSCEPNCAVVPVRTEIAIPKLAIFTCQNVKADEELTFCYGWDSLCGTVENYDPDAPRRKCFCNTSKCSGYMPLDNFDYT